MKRGWLLAGVIGVLGVAAALVWFLFIRSDAPEALTIEGAVEQLTSTTAPPDSTEAPISTAPATDAPPADDNLDGRWIVDQANTVVGYRIGEELSGFGVTEAVGRTSDVEAELVLEGTVIESVEVTVNMASLESDSSRRDGALANRGLETATFPEASFSLTEPIDLGVVPTEGETLTAAAVGDLMLHGVTRSVSIPLEAQLVGGTVLVVGSLDIALADYDIDKPTGFAVLSIEDVGTLELSLAFIAG